MKYMRKFSIFLFLLPVFLTGAVSAKRNDLHIITQAQIIYRRENTTITRRYIQPYKISAILNYLRILEYSGKADTDPEQLTGDSFEIILYDASGQCSIYRQRANRFFSKNSGPWKKISQEQASLLHSLIQSMPTDKQTQSKSFALRLNYFVFTFLPL